MTPATLVGHSLWDIFDRALVEQVDRCYKRAFAGERVAFAFTVFGVDYFNCAAPFDVRAGRVISIVAVAIEGDVGHLPLTTLVSRLQTATSAAAELSGRSASNVRLIS